MNLVEEVTGKKLDSHGFEHLEQLVSFGEHDNITILGKATSTLQLVETDLLER